MIALSDVATAVGEMLAAWGPTTFGAQDVPRGDHPRRFVWVPVSVSFAAPEKLDGALCKGLITAQIHSWGRTEEECWYMQAAVFSALRDVLAGRRFQPQAAKWTTRQDAHRGAALVTDVVIDLPVPRIDVPLTAAQIDELVHPLVTVEDTSVTGEIES